MLRKYSANPIRIAETERERYEIFRFRYQIYIEEMAKPYRHADHENKILTDPLDETGTILYAEENGQITGTVRINWGVDQSTLDTFYVPFSLELFRDFPPENFSFTSRLMVGGKQRRSALAANLCNTAYRVGRQRGVQFSFAHCNPRIAGLFQHLGFRTYKEDIEDEEVGRQTPLVILLQDVEHLRAVDSPFLIDALHHNNSSVTRRWFEKRFLNSDPIQNNKNNSGTEKVRMNLDNNENTIKSKFKNIVEQTIEAFPNNEVCRKVDRRDFTLTDYHKVLRMIFNQTHDAPLTFALAGVNCPPRLETAREYLLHHANEEKLHWQWVLNDLSKTGYRTHNAEDLTSLPPLPACQNYVAFNYYVALKMPVARLATAVVLEGIGAQYGGDYATKICQLLQLKPEQAQFYVGHGHSDREHIKDIWRTIDQCDLTDDEWQWMIQAAQTAGTLYRAMYDEALNH